MRRPEHPIRYSTRLICHNTESGLSSARGGAGVGSDGLVASACMQVKGSPDSITVGVKIRIIMTNSSLGSKIITDSELFFRRFTARVASQGGAPAVHFAQRSVTYAELHALVLDYRAALSARGVGPSGLVGVCVKRNEHLVALLIAIWSLRAAYVPVDPAYPSARQEYILTNAGVDLIVMDTTEGAPLLLQAPAASMAELREAGIGKAVAPSEFGGEQSDLAYLIYTSGSTGNPKGVAVTHGNVANFLVAMAARPGFTASDRVLAVTTVSFDIHILEIFLPLYVGGQIVLASEQEAVSQTRLRQLVNDYAIAVMQATPATWQILLDRDWVPKRPLKILIGGEALPVELLGKLHAASHELWNMYGPTETTVWSSCALIKPTSEKVTIGTPIDNTEVLIVDEDLRDVAQGVQGELLIGGLGVAQGYHNNPELTATRFIRLERAPDQRFYRTGDLVVQNAQGELEYINRIDSQIKVRGYRIEPSEIERVLESLPQVTQCIVVAANIDAVDRRLLAFYSGTETALAELIDCCSAQLPAHFLPQHFVYLERFPLTANLKVDRKYLTENALRFMARSRQGPSEIRDDLDRSIIAVWQKALAVSNIGIDDNFFHMGGHSLLALQVISDMRKATGIDFSDTLIFEAPTIRTLLNLAGEDVHRAASVVQLNQTYSGEPLFCLCGVEIYQALANCFDKKRPVFGVFSKEEIAIIQAQDANVDLNFNFELLVQTYVDAILRQGYFPRISLAGFSFGGLLALEVAKCLRSRNVEVTNVILLDSYFASSVYRSIREMFLDLAKALFDKDRRALLRQRSYRVFAKIRNRRLNQTDFSKQFSEREKAFDRAAEAYKSLSKQYPFDALLIKAIDTNFGFGHRSRPDYGLSQFIQGQLSIASVSSDHMSMLRPEHIDQVYQLINDYEHARCEPSASA